MEYAGNMNVVLPADTTFVQINHLHHFQQNNGGYGRGRQQKWDISNRLVCFSGTAELGGQGGHVPPPNIFKIIKN